MILLSGVIFEIRIVILFLLAACFVCFFPTIAYSQEDATKLFSSSVREVLTIPIEESSNDQVTTTASKSEETVQEASAIVSIITEKEITLFGALKLSDLLNRIVGTWTYSTYYVANNVFTIRGSITAQDNFHVLILINGRPSRENLRNGQNSAFYNSFPLHIIKRIEVMRGPGSVLYGTSAFMGIINIITKEAQNQEENIGFRYGSFNTNQFYASGGKRIGGVSISGSVNYLTTNGWRFKAIDEMNQAGEFDVSKNLVGANLGITYKNLTINAYYGNSSQDAMGNLPRFVFLTPTSTTPMRFRVTTPRLFTDIGYKKQISPFWTISFNLTNNYGQDNNSRPEVGFETLQLGKSNGLLGEITNYFQYKKTSLIVGGVINRLSGETYFYDITADGRAYSITQNTALTTNPFVAIAPFSEVWYSGYFQGAYKAKKWLNLVVGGQLNKTHGTSVDFVPRLGVIMNLENGLSAKLLYGQAFRAPVGRETDLKNLGTLYGNPNLTPEKNATTELQIAYNRKKFNLALTFFQVNQFNLITRSNPQDSLLVIDGKKNDTPLFINQSRLTIRGVELEGKGEIGSRIYILFSASYQENVDDRGRENYLGTPNLMLKGGVAYQTIWGLGIGIFNTYSGMVAPITLLDAQNRPLTRNVNGEVRPFHFMTANISLDLKKYYRSSRKVGVILNFYITNVLDQEINYAEYIRRNVNSIQGMGGRAVYANLLLRF